MAGTTLKVVKVFIGSPGGLDEERQTAKRIVDEINRSHSEHWKCQLSLVGWEATLPGYSRAQSLINSDLDKCDYFIGIVWNHWGSKPDGGDSKYSSGFEEEFERAKSRISDGLMLDIALFFKSIPDVQLNDPGPSAQKVVEFKEKCINERKPLFKTFNEIREFETHIRATLESFGWAQSEIGEWTSNAADPDKSPNGTSKQAGAIKSAGRLIEGPAATFVEQLLDREADWEAITSTEIARFRLISLSHTRSGNDEAYVGNHDSNLLFSARNSESFSSFEYCALIDAAVVGYHHQNIPLWHWIANSSSNDPLWRIKVLAAVGNGQERPNAIRLLNDAGLGVPTINEYFTEEKVISDWILDKDQRTFDRAIELLKKNGSFDNIQSISNVFDQAAPARQSILAATLIVIMSKFDLLRAFDMLFQLNPDTRDNEISECLFASHTSITTDILLRSLSLKSDSVRQRAAALLRSRGALDISTAEKLITDNDIEVRLIAVERLVDLGKSLPDDIIKKALVRPESSGIFGSTKEDDRVYDRFRRSQLNKLSYDELLKKVNNSSIYSTIEISVLESKFTKRRSSEIRLNLGDNFSKFANEKLKGPISFFNPDNGKDVQLVEFVKSQLASSSLDALCSLQDKNDLPLVRAALDERLAYFIPAAMRYIGRFGDWSDCDRILRHGDKLSVDIPSVLPTRSGNQTQIVADALYSVGKLRIGETLNLKLNNKIRIALINRLTINDIQSLSDDIAIRMLKDEDDEARSVAAMKFVVSLPRTKLRKYLDKYLSIKDNRYYNSIHWLDLGVSMPLEMARSVSRAEIKKIATR